MFVVWYIFFRYFRRKENNKIIFIRVIEYNWRFYKIEVRLIFDSTSLGPDIRLRVLVKRKHTRVCVYVRARMRVRERNVFRNKLHGVVIIIP